MGWKKNILCIVLYCFLMLFTLEMLLNVFLFPTLEMFDIEYAPVSRMRIKSCDLL